MATSLVLPSLPVKMAPPMPLPEDASVFAGAVVALPSKVEFTTENRELVPIPLITLAIAPPLSAVLLVNEELST